MATLTKPETRRRIPVRPAVPIARLKAQFRRSIRRYERRYEISTSQMFDEVEAGLMRETVEILKWMFAYHELEFLQAKTATDGNGSTATASSRRNGSKSTRP